MNLIFDSKGRLAGREVDDDIVVTDSPAGEQLADWLRIGIPVLRGRQDGDEIVEVEEHMVPDEPFFGLALLEHFEREEWEVREGPETEKHLPGQHSQASHGRGGVRAARAKRTHKPSTAEKQRRGETEQARLAKAVGGEDLGDNLPFDVLVKQNAVEVKTVMDNNNDKITVHSESRRRKEAEAKRKGYKTHTVAIDVRGGRRTYYYREGVGAYRLTSMDQVSLATLKGILG